MMAGAERLLRETLVPLARYDERKALERGEVAGVAAAIVRRRRRGVSALQIAWWGYLLLVVAVARWQEVPLPAATLLPALVLLYALLEQRDRLARLQSRAELYLAARPQVATGDRALLAAVLGARGGAGDAIEAQAVAAEAARSEVGRATRGDLAEDGSHSAPFRSGQKA